MTLGEKIKTCRLNSKMSQEKVAELIGVSRQAVTKWEANQSAPSTENLFKLAGIFGTTVDMLAVTADEAEQSRAERDLYLYRLEEMKKDEEHRAKLRRNLRTALLITAGYITILLLVRLICGGLGRGNHLIDWLMNTFLFHIAAMVSIVSALFGKSRFSWATLAAFTLGLILGELFERIIGLSRSGWTVWGGIFLVSIVIGVVWEHIVKRRLPFKSKKVWIGFITALVGSAAIITLLISIIPKYPSPEYPAASYHEFVRALSGNPQYIIPNMNLLPDAEGSYTIYLDTRFSFKKAGYNMGFKPIIGQYRVFTITCRPIRSLIESELRIQPNTQYNGVELSVTQTNISFIFNQCRYDIHFTGASQAFSLHAMRIAQSIINNNT